MSSDAPIPFRLLRRRRPAEPPRREVTAFVLSGGASLGAIQVGMVQALLERGITADLMVGTSVGALNAAYLASRPQTLETTEALAEVWLGLRRDLIFPLSIPALVSGLRGRADHLVSDRGLRDLAEEHLGAARLEDAAIPLHVTAYDVLSGEDVRLSHGPVLEAVLAASAIPGVYPPVEHGGRLLVDGGVVNNTPISHAVELGATQVYVLPTQAPIAETAVRPRGALDAAVNAVGLLINRRLRDDVERYAADADITLLQATNSARVQATDFSQAQTLIDENREAARAALDAAAAEQGAGAALAS